jgi:hypothetical protein
MTIQTGAEIWRKYEIPGVPASGPHKPEKEQIIPWATSIEGRGGIAALSYASKALLLADLAHVANSTALVWNDGTPANNGLYQKSGASGLGTWTRIWDLPGDVIRLTVSGGTPNAITATATETPLVPGNKLYLLTPTANNTLPVTINVNGAGFVAIKNALGSSLAANSLLDDLSVLMSWEIDCFQIKVSVPVDATGVLNDALDARDDAETARDAAEAFAALLGNQAATFDHRAQLAAATIAAGIKAARALGYYATGDCPVIDYYRVATQPTTAAKVRSVDRFLPNGTTDATNGGWWQMVISGPQDVRKFGVKFGVDSTTAANDAHAAANVFWPPGNYVLSGDVQTPSNRHIWVQKGASIVNSGGRFTSMVPGGGNIIWQIDGVMSFLATADAGSPGDFASWSVGARGLLEIGGTVASPASNIRVFGSGEFYADYVWPGTIPTGFYDAPYQLNRVGIGLFNVGDSKVEGLNVHNIHGQAIYNQSSGGVNVQFLNNRIHECGFNGLNFNAFGNCYNYRIAGNHVQNVMQGIEASVGIIEGNTILFSNKGILTGAGVGTGPLRITNNTIDFPNVGIDVSFQAGTIVENVMIADNQVHVAGNFGIALDSITSFQLKDNTVYIWGANSAGGAIALGANVTNGQVDGNTMTDRGPHSTGTIINGGVTGVTFGVNPVL